MQKYILPTLLAVLFLSACQPKDNQPKDNTPLQDSTPPPPPGPAPQFEAPEGTAYDGQFLYVSNLGPNPDPQKKDGNGFVMRLNPEATEWIDKDAFGALTLHAPKGMVALNGMLYATDVDRLVAIDLKKNQIASTIDFSGQKTTFLNDIAKGDDSTLYVSATDINAIFKVNLNTQSFTRLNVKGLNGPNGLLYESEEDKLYCAEYGDGKPTGRLLRIDPRSGKTEVLHAHRGSLDGLVRLRSGELAFSDWNTKSVHRLDLHTGTLSTITTDSINGPADIGYDPGANRLWIPKMMENSLTVMQGDQLQ